MEKKVSVNSRIMFVAMLNITIVVLELVYGSISNSLALITDALHNLGDVLALFVALIASYYALKAASSKMTFGYVRAEMMAAFVNSLFLCITMTYILYESVLRFFNPILIETNSVILVATVALIVNGISAYLLKDYHHLHHHHGHKEHNHNHENSHSCNHQHSNSEDLNMKAAYLHMLGDAGISLGVIIGAIATMYLNTPYIDPIITFLFGVYILKSSFSVLQESFMSLMDANKEDISKYEKMLLSFDEIEAVHDIHLIHPSSKEKYFSSHIILKDNLSLKEIELLLETIRNKLKHLGVSHSLLQPESTKYSSSTNHCDSHFETQEITPQNNKLKLHNTKQLDSKIFFSDKNTFIKILHKSNIYKLLFTKDSKLILTK
ncbi:MAG: cation diffusion facilitator family transporter [Arcobacteraceae bacterium]|nr:cation diffusion facilitator family transporter [Arcobacteraceae bacterium]MDY0326932.1 cation diffusion facilitator family transporter [Arcobacteraceae bacterium]